MVKDPRTPKPGSPEPDDALDLLRALARSRGTPSPGPRSSAPEDGEAEKLDALRALAERLDRQLKTPPPAADLDPSSHSGAARPPPPARARDWRETMRREWAALAEALPDSASLVPRLERQHLVYAVVAGVVLASAAIGALIGGRPSPDVAPPRTDLAVTPPAQLVPPTAQAPAQAPPADIPAITKAMSDCDTAAAQDPDSLYFLVLPLVPANRNDHDWRAIALQTVGNAYLLLSAKDALDGLRDRRLVLRPDRYTFSVLDSGSGATYSWTSATGISRLARRDSGAVKTLKLGFDFSPTQVGAQWSAEFKRDRGTCYWVTVLVRE